MRDMRLLIRRLADQGMTVLLSSHLLNEVEDVCNRVAIVRSGRIVYEGEIATLKRGAGTRYWLETTDDDRALAVCRAQPGISDVRRTDNLQHGEAANGNHPARAMRVSFAAEDDAAVGLLSQALVESGTLIHALTPQSVTLEDLFFSFTEGDEAPVATAGPAETAEPAERAG
jgi:ABC-2 type transport system ATP-binding protein